MWRAAPSLLLHYPSLFVATALGALLLALALASYPLFVSAASSSALKRALAGAGRFDAGALVTPATSVFEPSLAFLRQFTAKEDLISRRSEGISHVGDPVFTMVGAEASLPSNKVQGISVRMTSRSNFLQHIDVLRQVPGRGSFMADVVADQLGVRPGDDVRLVQGGASARVRVKGIYGALGNRASSSYWESLRPHIYARTPDDDLPPPFLLMDQPLFDDLSAKLRQGPVLYSIELPVSNRDDLTVTDAQELERQLSTFSHELQDPRTAVRDCHALRFLPRRRGQARVVIADCDCKNTRGDRGDNGPCNPARHRGRSCRSGRHRRSWNVRHWA